MDKLMYVAMIMGIPPYAMLFQPISIKAQLIGLSIQIVGLILAIYCYSKSF